MTQLELFENEPLKPIQTWLHVWSEAERERRIKRPHPSGREANVVGKDVTQLSSACGDSSADNPKECRDAESRTGHSHAKPAQSPGNGRQESDPAPSSWTPRFVQPQSPEPAN